MCVFFRTIHGFLFERDKVKITVIVVCFNAKDKLINTISGLNRQTFRDFEVLVKDGMSDDGSFEQLTKLVESDYFANLSRRIRLIAKPDKGIYDAMNQAVSLALGDYVIFINCGDGLYDENVLEKLSFKLPDNSDNSKYIIYGDTFFEAKDVVMKAVPKITGEVCYRKLPCHQSTVYGRNVLLERGYDTSYAIRADNEHFHYCFFKTDTVFLYADMVIAAYEGRGFSESPENKKKDEAEFKRIVKLYHPLAKRFVYRTKLVLTLYKLRGRIASNPKYSKAYEKMLSRLRGTK